MTYILGDGTVREQRSWFRFSIITDFFWAILNTIGLFVNTLINPKAPLPKGRFQSRSSGAGGGSAARFRPTNQRGTGANIRTLPKPSCTPKG